MIPFKNGQIISFDYKDMTGGMEEFAEAIKANGLHVHMVNEDSDDYTYWVGPHSDITDDEILAKMDDD